MLLRGALTITRMWTCTGVAPVKTCHVVVNRNRGGSVAIIAEKPLRARGGFFRLSQQLTNGQPCFLARSHPGFISSSSLEIQKKKSRVFNMLSRVVSKWKHGFISFNGMFVCVCAVVSSCLVQDWPQGNGSPMPPPCSFPPCTRLQSAQDMYCINAKCDRKLVHKQRKNRRHLYRAESGHLEGRGQTELLSGDNVWWLENKSFCLYISP